MPPIFEGNMEKEMKQELVLAVGWGVKEENGERSIQLFDKYDNKVKGEDAKWGGDFYCYSNQLTSLEGAPKVNVQNLRSKISVQIFDAKITRGYVCADGILEKLLSRKALDGVEIFKTKAIGSSKTRFVVKRGSTFSHGETVKEAMDDLQYKISDRDTTKYQKWTLETVATKPDMIAAYRKITGACASGVKSFIESRAIGDSITVKDAVEITVDSYGHNIFRRFFHER